MTTRRALLCSSSSMKGEASATEWPRLAHRARDRMADAHAAPAFAEVRPQRRARARGLEAEQAAAGRRNADRAAAVGRMRHRQHAGRHRGGGTTARAAGAELEVPRVAGR